VEVTAENLDKLRGRAQIPLWRRRRRARSGRRQVTGLAWTEVGGETLTIEAVMLPGKGRFQPPASWAM
jgi:ATP-dependent Lon protease